MDDPASLLVGPRGRRLCLELAMALARDASSPARDEFLRAAFFAAHHLDPGRGSSRAMLMSAGDEPPRPEPTPTPDDVARLLGALPLQGIDDRVLLDSLAAAVNSARYWQEPDGEDLLTATPAVLDALAPIAAAAASSDGAAWWATRLEGAGQWGVEFEDAAPRAPGVPGTAVEHLARWRREVEQGETLARRERPSDPRANVSGTWWSTPPRELVRTTRSLGALGPVGLRLVEDALGWDRATARPVEVPRDAIVYEVDGPEAWARLCRSYPLDVTASRRHDWFRTTGSAGPWVIPDWPRAAAEYEAVHLTVAGYLTTAGRAIALGDDSCSVLAGWDPDQTYWLTDVVEPVAGAERRWVRRDDNTWLERA